MVKENNELLHTICGMRQRQCASKNMQDDRRYKNTALKDNALFRKATKLLNKHDRLTIHKLGQLEHL